MSSLSLKIHRLIAALQAQFLTADPLPEMILLNPMDDGPHARFLAFRGDGATALHDALADRNIVTDVRGDVLRIGFAIYHDAEDVTRLVDNLTQIPMA
ncbi:hypothetical protein MNBD_ALPHA04-1103 [hydrothermal vent metagenome]|uniref:Cysteine desulfurase n=1 Tax=hydrothermal vent metagenome TaxID=652676 RepID=A0A3B0RAL8_9ZZZZ